MVLYMDINQAFDWLSGHGRYDSLSSLMLSQRSFLIGVPKFMTVLSPEFRLNQLPENGRLKWP